MKIAILSVLGGLAGFGLLAHAAIPSASSKPVAGKIILLDNDQLIEGDIIRDGDVLIIRRGIGETTVPANRVVEIVADRKQAYRAMRERCNLRDQEDRLRLVRWAMQNGLREEALAEAELLHRNLPKDAQIATLLEGLRELKKSPTSTPLAPAKLPGKVVEIEPAEFDRDSYILFATKVQPILMNACANCHAGGQGGDYTLVRVVDGSRKATLANITTSLKQLKKDDLGTSPLLLKAVAAHGKATLPPLRDRTGQAFQYLEMWADMAAIRIPAPAQPADVVVPPRFEEKRTPAAKSVFGETSMSQPLVEPQTQAKDPFDPAIFNGTIQPKK